MTTSDQASQIAGGQTTDLSRRVAEAAGWRFEFIETALTGLRYFRVFAPDGSPVYFVTAYDSANHWPEYELSGAYPDYEHDANAALTLRVEGYFLHLYQDVEGFIACYTKGNKNYTSRIRIAERKGATPAAAICLAYLALVDVKVNKA